MWFNHKREELHNRPDGWRSAEMHSSLPGHRGQVVRVVASLGPRCWVKSFQRAHVSSRRYYVRDRRDAADKIRRLGDDVKLSCLMTHTRTTNGVKKEIQDPGEVSKNSKQRLPDCTVTFVGRSRIKKNRGRRCRRRNIARPPGTHRLVII